MGYGELHRWSVRSFFEIGWQWPERLIKPLGRVLQKRTEVVDRNRYDLGALGLVTLHFDGDMEPRDFRRDSFKGRLVFAHPGDVIYSKIDVRNGAIGIVPQTWGKVAVSSEYPVYRIKHQEAIPEYIKLLFRTGFFRAAINSMISGTSGRKRVQPGDLEQIEVPIPPISVQRAIVDRWDKAREAVEKASGQLNRVVAELDELLESEYRKQTAFSVRQRFLGVNWRDIAAWDMKSARAAAYRMACPQFIPMSAFAEEVTELVRPWEEPDKPWPVYGVNNTDGVFLSGYQMGSEFNAAYKRVRRDWFFHNPTRANVGSLGIVPDVQNDAITSPEYQVWRLKDDTPPGYVATLINTNFFLELVQFHRVGAVKQRLYVENLLRIPVPQIPRKVQDSIAEARAEALEAIVSATERADRARAEVEEMILGVRPVEDIKDRD